MRRTYHNPCKQTHAFPTVRVWYHVPVANGEEGNRNEPHGSQKVTGDFLFVMIPKVTKIRRGGRHTVSKTEYSSWKVSMLRNGVCECCVNQTGAVGGGGGGGEDRGGGRNHGARCYTCFVKSQFGTQSKNAPKSILGIKKKKNEGKNICSMDLQERL